MIHPSSISRKRYTFKVICAPLFADELTTTNLCEIHITIRKSMTEVNAHGECTHSSTRNKPKSVSLELTLSGLDKEKGENMQWTLVQGVSKRIKVQYNPSSRISQANDF